MLKAIKALENYIDENLDEHVRVSKEHLLFFKSKIKDIRTLIEEMERLVSETQSKSKTALATMQQRVTEAETREKLNIERQKVFGETQTKVETERHKNILEELNLMKEYGITTLNRSSYPFYPRHDKRKLKKQISDNHPNLMKIKKKEHKPGENMCHGLGQQNDKKVL